MTKETIEKVKKLDSKITQYNGLLEEIQQRYRWKEFRDIM